MQINMKVNDYTYQINVYENKTTKELIKHLPKRLVMNDLNSNEKYASLNRKLPTAPEKVEKIHKGDVMLFGSDTIVIFYKDMETIYSYTPIGKVSEPKMLEEIASFEQIEAQFEMNNKVEGEQL